MPISRDSAKALMRRRMCTPHRRVWENVQPESKLAQLLKTSQEEYRDSTKAYMICMFVVGIFFTLAIIYASITAKDAIGFGLEYQANSFPVCNLHIEPNTEPGFYDVCLEGNEILPAVKMARILHPELLRRAISHSCSDIATPIMNQYDVMQYLIKKEMPGNNQYMEPYFRALIVLVLSNPQWGIMVLDIETGISSLDKANHKLLIDTGSLLMAHPALPLVCSIKLLVIGLLPLASIIALGLCSLFLARTGIQRYVSRKEQDKLEICSLVEKIIDVLVKVQQAAPNPAPICVPVKLVQNELIPIADRKRMTPMWESAVHYIHEKESRIKCRTQILDGEELAVWYWIPHSVSKKSSFSLGTVGRKNKVWQGQAFDAIARCPKSITSSLTPCLKIENMFDLDMESGDNWPITIEDAVLDKCGEQGIGAVHIHVEKSNKDGSVYLKCASENDSGQAYRALHGWWFDSRLVTVKFLRLERYHEKFPEAEDAFTHLSASNNEKLSLQWRGPFLHV